MNEIKVEMLSDEVNAIVLRTPGRNFPGMVIQGDNLRSLHRLAERIHAQAHTLPSDELRDDIDDLCECLRERILAYESVLERHGIPLPYPDRVSTTA